MSILGIVCGMPAYNHTLLSVKGGGDLRRVMLYNEPETVLLDLDGWMIVLKPKELRIELFANSAWNYLVLTADHLPAIEGIPCAKNVQELVCDFPQHYVDAKDAVYGVYDYDSGRRLPTDALRLERWMSGSLLIVPKEGPYNRIQSVYDGRHDELSHEDFRNYINQLCLWAGGGDKWRTSDLNRIDDILSSEKQHRVVEHLRHSVCGISPSEYIKGNWQKFGVSLFDDCRRRQCSCMQYWIALQPTEISFGRAGFAEADKYVLSCDGKLLPDGCEKNKIMYVDDVENAVTLLRKIEEAYDKWCLGSGFHGHQSGYAFKVKFQRRHNPTHLFTPGELKHLLISADDRQWNQIVVTGDGRLEMLRGNWRPISCYPVNVESYGPRNNNVGKYARWSDKQLASLYFDLLAAWALHLEYGRTMRVDGTPLGKVDVENLVKHYDHKEDVLAVLNSSTVNAFDLDCKRLSRAVVV